MIEWIGYIVIGLFAIFFLKDILLMPFVIGEAKDTKDYLKTIGVVIIVIGVIFAYSYVMGGLFD